MQDAPAQSNSVSVLPLTGYLDETSLFLDMLMIKWCRISTLGTNAKGFW
jgi:hypothetical protein